MGAIEFKVVEIDPENFCMITPETMIFFEGDSLIREDEALTNDVSSATIEESMASNRLLVGNVKCDDSSVVHL